MPSISSIRINSSICGDKSVNGCLQAHIFLVCYNIDDLANIVINTSLSMNLTKIIIVYAPILSMSSPTPSRGRTGSKINECIIYYFKILFMFS